MPHEVWHVVQQKQQRVRPTSSVAGAPTNSEPAFEAEAERMGARAASHTASTPPRAGSVSGAATRSEGSRGQQPVLQGSWFPPTGNLDREQAIDRINRYSLDYKRRSEILKRQDLGWPYAVALFGRADVVIDKDQARQWLVKARLPAGLSAPPGESSDAGPQLVDPTRDPKVVEEWNDRLKQAGVAELVEQKDVTTIGDGAQLGGPASSAGGGKKSTGKRNPLHEKALKAMQAYDLVDRKKMKIPALFGNKASDLEHVESLRQRGAFVEGKEPNDAPEGATYVIGKSSTDNKGKTVRSFVASGIIVENKEGVWTTIDGTDLGARTDTALAQLRFRERTYAKSDIVGWFVPDKLPSRFEMPGQSVSELRDAYDQTNVIKHPDLISEADQGEEALELLKQGHSLMGADWHGHESFYWRPTGQKEELVIKGKRIEVWDPKLKKKVPKTRDVLGKVPGKPLNPKARAKAVEITGEVDPQAERVTAGSIFTTCLATASATVRKYGINPAVFGGLMAPVHQQKRAGLYPREQMLFKYLKDAGAWIWGSSGFVPIPGDIFLTGSYQETVNQAESSRGFWTFQHVGIIANTRYNADETYTLLTQDGGKGNSALGEDKTGYTIRNYDPKTRLVSGASPKMIIGVWRSGVLKAALEKMPPDVEASLKGQDWRSKRSTPAAVPK